MTPQNSAPVPPTASRFDRNAQVYVAGLLSLFAGLAQLYSWGVALTVRGSILIGVSVASSFFVTWLSTRIKKI